MRLAKRSSGLFSLLNALSKRLSTILFTSLIVLAFNVQLLSSAWAAPLKTTIISTQKPATQLIEHLTPLITPPASITAIDHQLIIRANASAVTEIKTILIAIDVAPENLIVQIRQHAPQRMHRKDPSKLSGSTSTRISTKTLREPKISSYKLIEGEALVIQQSASPGLILNLRPSQSNSPPFFALTLSIDRIGERLQLRYTLQESHNKNLSAHSINGSREINRIEGVLLGHMNSWMDLTATSPQSTPTSQNTPQHQNTTTRSLPRAHHGSPPAWQVRIQREHSMQ
ncbi:MAG: hypothetical protein COB04_00685 [Gammaproteobacteria bacterium]|nr:MAG: hypothetical protein COB04_00685 [Gammaproteobacteria bacterium]